MINQCAEQTWIVGNQAGMIFGRLKQGVEKRFAVYVARVQRKHERAICDALMPRFSTQPKNFFMGQPSRVTNPACIAMGDNVWIGPNSLLIAITQYPGSATDPAKRYAPRAYSPQIFIGNNVTATAGLQVAALEKIVIEDDVIIATNVNMTDGLHGFENVEVPYKYQPMFRIAPIVIKRGSWIGQNVLILPGVTVGEFCIIGANSVVTRDIPPRSIAVGAPARVVKKWDSETNSWVPAACNGG